MNRNQQKSEMLVELFTLKRDGPIRDDRQLMKRLNLRIALVIEEADALRHAMVQLLRIKGWIVHGISRAEQALPILRHIPYNLIVINCEQSSMTATEFAWILRQSGKEQAIQLVAIIDSLSRSLGAELVECGAFLARKPAWRDDM